VLSPWWQICSSLVCVTRSRHSKAGSQDRRAHAAGMRERERKRERESQNTMETEAQRTGNRGMQGEKQRQQRQNAMAHGEEKGWRRICKHNRRHTCAVSSPKSIREGANLGLKSMEKLTQINHRESPPQI